MAFEPADVQVEDAWPGGSGVHLLEQRQDDARDGGEGQGVHELQTDQQHRTGDQRQARQYLLPRSTTPRDTLEQMFDWSLNLL